MAPGITSRSSSKKTVPVNFTSIAVNIDPALGAPTLHLTYAFVSVPGTGQGVNPIHLDDFFISTGEYNATIPYVPVVGPTEIRITGGTYDTANGSFTITWGSQAGISYNVQKQAALSGEWAPLATGHPTGGATELSTSYTDTTASGEAAYYRVVYAP